MAAVAESDEGHGNPGSEDPAGYLSHDSSPSSSDDTTTPTSRFENTRKLQLSRQGIKTAMELRASTKLTELAMADEPMAIAPWCRKCAPLRPYVTLPLKPEEVDPANLARIKTLDNQRHAERQLKRQFRSGHFTSSGMSADDSSSAHSLGYGSGDGGSPLPVGRAKVRFSRIGDFIERMKAPISTPTFLEEGVPVAESVGKVELLARPNRSKFSEKPYRSRRARVLRKLTENQVGALERFCIHHVKLQYIEVSAAARAAAPREDHRHQQAMKYATLCHLLRKMKSTELTGEENEFLFSKLETVPLISEMPSDLVAKIAEHIGVVTFVKGMELFKEQDPADSLYILVQGQVELRSDLAGSMAQEATKEAPAVILPQDIIQRAEQKRPFLLRPPKDRVRSRTAVTSFSGEDATTLVMFLHLPFSILKAVSQHFREIECGERNGLVQTVFAQRMRLEPPRCLKNCDVFELEYLHRNHLIVQEGTMPVAKTSRLHLIIEGDVRLVYSRKKVVTRGRRRLLPTRPTETAGPGSLVGEPAIYGEPSPYSAVVASDSCKALSIRVGDYLDRFFHRSIWLERPFSEWMHLDNSGEDALAAADDARADKAKALFENHKVTLRRRMDLDQVKVTEWKRVTSKGQFPQTRGPPPPRPSSSLACVAASQGRASPAASLRPGSSASGHWAGGLDSIAQDGILCAPTDISHLRYTQDAGLALASLDRKLAESARTSDLLEATHRGHMAYRFHVEDATAASPVALPLQLAAPGSAVLFTCGAVFRPRGVPTSPSGRSAWKGAEESRAA